MKCLLLAVFPKESGAVLILRATKFAKLTQKTDDTNGFSTLTTTLLILIVMSLKEALKFQMCHKPLIQPKFILKTLTYICFLMGYCVKHKNHLSAKQPSLKCQFISKNIVSFANEN